MTENGKLAVGSLAPVPGTAGAYLTVAAAASWGRLRERVQATYGWTPAPTSAADCYRSFDIQERIFRQRYTAQATGSGPYGDVRTWNGVRYVRTSGAAAAVPGTSNHGWAIAVDVSDMKYGTTRFSQFSTLAVPEGWSNTEGRSVDEAWHWVFGTTPTNPGTDPDPTTPSPEEDDMRIALITTTGTSAWAATDGLRKRILAPGEPQTLADLGLIDQSQVATAKWIPNALFDALPTVG